MSYDEIRGILYKLIDCIDYMKKISELNDCNTCAAKKDCRYTPKPGQMARINCFSWVGKGKD